MFGEAYNMVAGTTNKTAISRLPRAGSFAQPKIRSDAQGAAKWTLTVAQKTVVSRQIGRDYRRR